jgi:hypothetical protein
MQLPLQVENKVVAVDLSAWLMQAQSQPALLEHYDSPYARAAKVVFDRVSKHCCAAMAQAAHAVLDRVPKIEEEQQQQQHCVLCSAAVVDIIHCTGWV